MQKIGFRNVIFGGDGQQTISSWQICLGDVKAWSSCDGGALAVGVLGVSAGAVGVRFEDGRWGCVHGELVLRWCKVPSEVGGCAR